MIIISQEFIKSFTIQGILFILAWISFSNFFLHFNIISYLNWACIEIKAKVHIYRNN